MTSSIIVLGYLTRYLTRVAGACSWLNLLKRAVFGLVLNVTSGLYDAQKSQICEWIDKSEKGH